MNLPRRHLVIGGLAAAGGAAAAEGGHVVSPATVTPLIELYTSEGCSSCPPADRWLSGWKDRPDVVAVAFHVSYWDHLGWRDRFGRTEYAARQARQRAVNGARVSYTPQVVIDGRDRPDWPRAGGTRLAPPRPAIVTIRLGREGERFVAEVEPQAGAPALLGAWWALTEDNHASHVRAGENDGALLRHDFVVREHREVAAWPSRPGSAQRLAFVPAAPAESRHPRRLALVVTDAGTGAPLQAVQLPC